MFMSAGGLLVAGLIAGCGSTVASSSPVSQGPLDGYRLTVIQSVPSQPKPLNITFRGILSPQDQWIRLTEQIGSTPPMVLVPLPPLPPSKAIHGKHPPTKTPEDSGVAVAALFRQAVAVVQGHSTAWPTAAFPLVSVTASQPLVVNGTAFHHTWHEAIALGSQSVSGTVQLSLKTHDKHGKLEHATWTLSVKTSSSSQTNAKGKTYLIPALMFSQTGHITAQYGRVSHHATN